MKRIEAVIRPHRLAESLAAIAKLRIAGVTVVDAVGFGRQPGHSEIYEEMLRYEGMENWLTRQPVDVALLPINGDDPARGVAGNLDGPQAARLARDIGARLVIPCHYEMFEFNTANPAVFAEACRALDQPFRILRAGERWSSPQV